MKYTLFALAWLASVASAAADASLQDMIGEASTCSDASLQDFASTTCDPPERIAAQAVAKCRAKWDAVVGKAVGPLSANPSPAASREHARSVKVYADAMEFEYIRVAELKAIDIRTAAGRCGFE